MDKKGYLKIKDKQNNISEKIKNLSKKLEKLKEEEASFLANQIIIIQEKENVSFFDILDILSSENNNKKENGDYNQDEN